MSAIAPVICFVFLFLSLCVHSARHDGQPSYRASLLAAAVVWAVLLTGITEILSIFNAITFGWVLTSWVLASLISASICFALTRRSKSILQFEVPKLHAWDIILLLGVAFIAVATGLIALLAPPNTWDSMTYHMGRVAHWMQNRSVMHYPTNILTQLYLNPWAEFAIMHFQILSKGDRLANFVEWFSMVGSILGVSLIAKQLGANTRGQILASVAAATIPIGILQASSTQNDHVVSFWLVCCVYYFMRAKRRVSWPYSLAAGASLGLAILTKGTAYLYAFPFVVWCGLSGLKAYRRRLWKPILIITLVAVLMNACHYVRNLDLFGNPLLPSSHVPLYSNRAFNPQALFSNVVRNLSLHIATPFERLNTVAERALWALHDGLNVDINSPRTTWEVRRFRILPTSYSENTDGNLAHVVLIAISLCSVVIWKKLRQLPDLLPYSVSLVTAFLLFNLYLRWNPWLSRLHLPLFILWSPVIGIVLSKTLNRMIANPIALALILLALPWVFFNRYRPLVGENSIFRTSRIDQYFAHRRRLAEPYKAAVEFLVSEGHSHVGLALSLYDWEYPFWVLFKEHDDQVRLEHIHVENASAEKWNTCPFTTFSPSAVISFGEGKAGETASRRKTFKKVGSWDKVSVFARQ